MKLHDLSALISVRDFAVKIFDNVFFKMSNDDVRQLRVKIAMMDQVILDGMLKLDLSTKVTKKNETTKQPE